MVKSSGWVQKGGSVITVSKSIRYNDIISVLLDMDNKEVEFLVNYVSVYKGSIEGYIDTEAYPIIELYCMNTKTNFGNLPFIYEIPDGYLPYAVKQK